MEKWSATDGNLTGRRENGNMRITRRTSCLLSPVLPIFNSKIQAAEGELLLNSRCCICVIVLSAVLPLSGCIAHAPGSGGGGGGSQPLTVTVSPTPSSLAVSTSSQPSTVQFSAVVSPSGTNQAVTWSLSLSSNSNASATGSGLGTITANGLYTAPTTIPSCGGGVTSCELQVVITATSVANSSYSGQTLVNVHVVVVIAPLGDTIGQVANLQFTATVIGTSNTGINWDAVGTTPNVGGGAFDPNSFGLFIAPSLPQGTSTAVSTISATSQFDQSQVASTNITVQETDPLGTASPSTAAGAQLSSCPTFSGGLTGATCYQVNTACDGIADYSVYLKVNSPAGTPKGTVIFGTGTGGSALYDYDPPDYFYNNGTTNGGLAVVQGVLNAGYTTVQISFGSPFNSNPGTENGWLQGPGGVRRLACRYATVANWVYQNIHNANTSAPFCATGNSGGSGAIGYAVSQYGLGSIFTMIEPTSGPVMTRLDLGCSPTGSFNYTGQNACTGAPTDMSYSIGNGSDDGTAGIIDTAYQSVGATTPTPCSDGVNGITTANTLRFESDSIEDAPLKSPPLPIPNPPTTVKVLFGGQDTSNAIPQGETWWSAVGPKPTQACVPNAPHAIPADPTGAGASQIVTDISTLCVLK